MKRVIVLAATLAACSPAPDSKPPAEEAPKTIAAEAKTPPPAPAPEVVVARITESQNGQVVEVPVGRPFSVVLESKQPQGFSWTTVEAPAFVTTAPKGSATLPAQERAAKSPPVVGLGGKEVFFFIATAPGDGALKLELRRFDGAPPTRDSFQVRLVAR